MDDKKRKLLNKIKKLAEQGVGGEKSGAERKLLELMEKYGVEKMDFSEDIPRQQEFKYKGEFQKRLLFQIISKVLDGQEVGIYHYKCGKGARSVLFVDCTDAEAIQIRIELEFYSELWEEEQQLFFQAFVQKHRLFSSHSDTEQEYTQAELEELVRMFGMMEYLKEKQVTPLLEGE